MTIEIWVQKLWIGVKFVLFLETADRLSRWKAVAHFRFDYNLMTMIFFLHSFSFGSQCRAAPRNPVQFNVSTVIKEQKVELYDGITIDKIKGVRDRNTNIETDTHIHTVRPATEGSGRLQLKHVRLVFHAIPNIQLKFISFHRSQWTWDLYWCLWSFRIV